MKRQISITTSEKIFFFRNFLQQISHISFSFSKLNQNYPVDTLSEEQGEEIIKAYKNLLSQTEKIIEEYKNC
jgi:hypothetical protein